MIELKIEEFESLPRFQNKEDIRRKYDTLYKRLDTDKGANIEFIKFLRGLPKIPGVVLPKRLIVSPGYKQRGEEPYGHTMNLVHGKNLDKFLHANVKNSIDTVKAIYDLFAILENIHEHFIFGDVRNSNIIMSSSGPVFVDAENGKKLGSDADVLSYYEIEVDDEFLEPTFISDNIKALLCALSIYYGFDFERMYLNQDIVYLLELLINIKAPNRFISYLDYLLDLALTYPNIKPKPFGAFPGELPPVTQDEIYCLTRQLIKKENS